MEFIMPHIITLSSLLGILNKKPPVLLLVIPVAIFLTSFYKFVSTFRTSNHNLSFSLRYPYLLLTVRTRIYTIYFSLLKHILLLMQQLLKLIHISKIQVIFPISSVYIS